MSSNDIPSAETANNITADSVDNSKENIKFREESLSHDDQLEIYILDEEIQNSKKIINKKKIVQNFSEIQTRLNDELRQNFELTVNRDRENAEYHILSEDFVINDEEIKTKANIYVTNLINASIEKLRSFEIVNPNPVQILTTSVTDVQINKVMYQSL